MTASGWIQLILILGALALLTKPLGVYLVQVLDPERKAERFSTRCSVGSSGSIYRVLRVNPERGQTWMQYTISMLIFSALTTVLSPTAPAPAGQAAAESAEAGRRHAAPGVQHLRQLHHQHELAELRRRIDHEVLLADGRAGDRTTSSPPPSASPSPRRWCAASPISQGKTIGNFWRDMIRLHSVSAAAAMRWCTPSSSSATGDPQNFRPYTAVNAVDQSLRGFDHPAGAADDRPGPGGVADRDQDARHQRRRLHERQLGASVRESHAAGQLHPDGRRSSASPAR